MKRDGAVVSMSPASTRPRLTRRPPCWSYGFGTVDVANALADAGLEPRRNYFVVLDELWRALRSGKGMVDRVDALTRLNRSVGVGQIMISHTMSDLLGPAGRRGPDEGPRLRGAFRHGDLRWPAGLGDAAADLCDSPLPPGAAETHLLAGPARVGLTRSRRRTPDRGKFLIKVGGRPGIPVQIGLTSIEKTDGLNDTDTRWYEKSGKVE